jgi:hypothetical protein
MVSKQLRRVSWANSFTVNQSFSVNLAGGSLRESSMKYVIAALSILVLVFVSGSVVLVGGAVSVPATSFQPK